jgi:hypothetical protein
MSKNNKVLNYMQLNERNNKSLYLPTTLYIASRIEEIVRIDGSTWNNRRGLRTTHIPYLLAVRFSFFH